MGTGDVVVYVGSQEGGGCTGGENITYRDDHTFRNIKGVYRNVTIRKHEITTTRK